MDCLPGSVCGFRMASCLSAEGWKRMGGLFFRPETKDAPIP
jgi:hypothetical protein